MILWDRIKKSLDTGIDHVVRVAVVVSGRVRVEAAVARLLVDKGSLETKLDICHKRIGDRTRALWEQKYDGNIFKDPDVADALADAAELKGRIEMLKHDIKRITVGEEDAL